MFGNTFGKLFKITCCGESYAGGFRKKLNLPEELYGGLLTIVDGVPAGIKITADLIQAELDKRKPGQTPLDSPRKEKDRVYIFSGVMENDLTTGAPVGLVIPNNDIQDVHIEQYRAYKDSIRPGHAEYGFFKKYGEHGDWVGAGRASGRETASRVAGGAVAKAILDTMGIDVVAYTVASHGLRIDHEVTYEEAKAITEAIKNNPGTEVIEAINAVIATKFLSEIKNIDGIELKSVNDISKLVTAVANSQTKLAAERLKYNKGYESAKADFIAELNKELKDQHPDVLKTILEIVKNMKAKEENG